MKPRENTGDVERFVTEIKRSKKYRNSEICEDTIRDLLRVELGQHSRQRDAIKAARKARGMTRPELAGMAGFEPTTLYRYETGAAFPRRDNLAAMKEVLGISYRDLFDWDEPAEQLLRLARDAQPSTAEIVELRREVEHLRGRETRANEKAMGGLALFHSVHEAFAWVLDRCPEFRDEALCIQAKALAEHQRHLTGGEKPPAKLKTWLRNVTEQLVELLELLHAQRD